MEIERLVAELTAVCEWQAETLSLAAPERAEIGRKVLELLVEREYYGAAMEGLLTIPEIASVIMAHFETLIWRSAGVPARGRHEELPSRYADIAEKIVEIIYT